MFTAYASLEATWHKSLSAVVIKWPGQAGGSGDGGVYGVRNLAHFEHKRTLLTWIIPYFR